MESSNDSNFLNVEEKTSTELIKHIEKTLKEYEKRMEKLDESNKQIKKTYKENVKRMEESQQKLDESNKQIEKRMEETLKKVNNMEIKQIINCPTSKQF